MIYDDPRDQHRGPNRTDSTLQRRSMAPLVLAALAGIALIALLSPHTPEVRDEPISYVRETVAPGPIPSTERRPDAAH
jgi:hypothetical protein